MATSYTILEKKLGNWQERGHESAASATAAIREFVGDKTVDEAAEFVAIPSRSWKPVAVKVERTVKIG